MEILILTNNPKVKDKYEQDFRVELLDSDNFEPVLMGARDYVQKGYKLLTHPLAGSIKPNQTPYKSMILSGSADNIALDYDSLSRIEEAVETFLKFKKNYPTPKWNTRCEKDFQTVDLSLMEGVLSKNMEVLYCEAGIRTDFH